MTRSQRYGIRAEPRGPCGNAHFGHIDGRSRGGNCASYRFSIAVDDSVLIVVSLLQHNLP